MNGPVVITGAAGFLGRALVEVIGAEFALRPTEVVPTPGLDPEFCGDLANRNFVQRLLEGAGALVISHMLPRGPGVYDHPLRPIEVNVATTANLLDVAVRQGCGKVILISSTAIFAGAMRSGLKLKNTLPQSPQDIYGLTKAMQESLARFYHEQHGLPVAILRPAYVTDEATMRDKHGREKATVNWQFIDRRDIGHAAVAALHLADLGCEAFFITGHASGCERMDLEPAIKRLGWMPRHGFFAYPLDS
jgi:UDP-glucose 4-epimerase